MRIRCVSVAGFGPLEHETLELAQGMTVVYGPNESAKTSLHAATYAAICGLRRSRGQPRREDAQFSARHRPWSGGEWKVGAQIVLADGREIELSHDLAGGVDCRATELALARDVSNEIMFDGAPDGSRWLGFDRQSFVATACVRQAEIAAVLADAAALQDEIQRAAASAGRDETAAQALERLRAFGAENVGRDIRNSARPLRRAISGVEDADRAHADAVGRHDEYDRSVASVDEREREHELAAAELKLAEAVVARADADEKALQARRAAQLAERHPEEPRAAAGQEELANAIAEALTRWEAAPTEPDLSGPSLEDLERDLGSVPERPEGDVAPVREVVAAHASLVAAEQLVEQHDAAAPSPTLATATADELHRLADALAAAPVADERVRAGVEELHARVGKPARTKRAPLLVAALLAAAGVVTAIAINGIVGAVVVAAAVLVVAVVLWMSRQNPDPANALAAAEKMLAEQEQARRELDSRRATSVARVSELGLPAEPEALRSIAAKVAQRDEWERRGAELLARKEQAARALRRELETRAIPVRDDLHGSVDSYTEACREREALERAALRRPGVEQRVRERRAADANAAARAGADTDLLRVARELRVSEADPAEAAQALRAWQEQRLGELEQRDVARAEWNELQLLLDGRSLAELEAERAAAAAVADEGARGVDSARLAEADAAAERAKIPALRDALAERAREADRARGQVEEMSRSVPSVAEAEEALEATKADLARVRSLERTLALTVQFLEAAQDRVHRTIAPILCETLKTWLPRVAVERQNGGFVERYDDVIVDPETLNVKVRRGLGAWRDVAYLSEGTKEQMYLLLRVALAKHLTTTGETAPLILDEVTAQCDSDRRVALLDLLHELSRERQVILFTHDEGVLVWVERALDLDGGHDRLEIREPVPVA